MNFDGLFALLLLNRSFRRVCQTVVCVAEADEIMEIQPVLKFVG